MRLCKTRFTKQNYEKGSFTFLIKTILSVKVRDQIFFEDGD